MPKRGKESTIRMKEWVRLIRRSASHSLFFNRLLDSNKYHSDLFMLHKDLLSPRVFPKEEIPNIFNPHLTYLFWSTQLYGEEYEEEASTGEITDSEVPIGMELQQTETSIGYEIFQENFDSIWDKLRYIIAWAAVEIIRQNESLKRCVELEDFDLKRLLKETKGLKDINTEGIVKKFKSIENEDGMAFFKRSPKDTDVERAAKKLMKTVSETLTKDPFQFLKLFDLGSIWYFAEPIGTEYTIKMLECIGLTPDLYAEIIDEMHYLGLVKSYRTVYICDECDIDDPIILSTGYDLRIQQAENITCPKCGETMHFFSIFKIDEVLSSFILSKDGLLSIFAAWLFDINRLNWRFSTYPGKSECDFELQIGDVPFIVEVKMRLHPNVGSGEWNAFEDKLNSGLKQLVDKIKEQNGKPQGILLVNLKEEYFEKKPDEIVEKYLKKRRLSLNKYKIKILPYNQLQEFIDALRNALPGSDYKLIE